MIPVIALCAIAAIALVYVAGAHWHLARRVSRIERARTSAGNSEQMRRIWRSVEFTEDRAKHEAALLAAAFGEEPVQLYRREGRRFIALGDVA